MFIDEKTGVTIHADLDTTVSRATMRTQDLIPAFLDILKDTMEYVQMMDYVPAYAVEDDDADWWDSEDASVFLNETLWSTLNSYAPDGYYFGSTEGDGSDYGFWECRIWCNQEEFDGLFEYGIFTVSEDGENLERTFVSPIAGLEFDPYGDDIPTTIGSNQIVKLLNGGDSK